MPFLPLALGFIKKPLVKYIGGAILIGLLLWLAIHKFNNWKDSLREEGRLVGRAEVTREFQAVVDENNRVNRRVEERVGVALDSFVGRLNQTLDRVRGESAQIAGDIINQIDRRPQVFNNPVCTTPQETIDSRNAIRRLGPPSRTQPLPTEQPRTQVPSQPGDAAGSRRFSDGSVSNADGSTTIPIR